MRLAAVALACMLLPSAAFAETRTYCGKLMSGGHIVPAETIIIHDAKGGLTGTYTFVDQGQVINGTLAQAQAKGHERWRFVWTDEYGSGQLDVKFNADESAFTGKWGDGAGKPHLPWNGRAGSDCLATPST
jgi:hypothetical protein